MYFQTLPKIIRMEVMDYFSSDENKHLLNDKRKLKVSGELAEKIADVIERYIEKNNVKE